MKARIVHLTTTHARDEVRIFHKECNSIAKDGYDVHLISADGKGFDEVNGVKRHGAQKTCGRFQRVFIQPWQMYLVARRLHASLYHLHEPELLLIALFLKRKGVRIVYDSHEDVPRAVMGRDWIHPLLKKIASLFFEVFEDFIVRRISAVIAATPHIAQRFSKVNSQTITVNNFPLISEMYEVPLKPCGNGRTICYIGGISRIRGLFEIIQALEYVDSRMVMAGPFEDVKTELSATKLTGWSKVDYRGRISRSDVYQLMSQSRAGLLIFHPEPNHVNAQPNKMFEYMSAGLPVIASHFPLFREIIEGNKCGLCVDPLNPSEIAKAIDYILTHPEEAQRMGENGLKAVKEQYNWDIEEKKLLALYEQLLNKA